MVEDKPLKQFQNASSLPAVSLQNPSWLSMWGSGGIPMFGSPVSEETSMAVAAVYRCVTLISGVTAALDMGIHYNDPDQGQVLVQNKVSDLFSKRPHPSRAMTSYTWKECLVMNLLLEGNAFSAIRYDQAGRVAALEYVHPRAVNVVVNNGETFYVIRWNDGREESTEVLHHEDMIHIAGPSYDGIRGVSRIRANARNSIAAARSIEMAMGKAFDNAVAPKTITKMSGEMTENAIKRLDAHINNRFGGRDNIGGNLILDANSNFEVLNMSLVDLQLIEASKFNVTQICSFFGVPPVLVGQDQHSTWGSGIQEIVLGFLRFSLNSDLERIEAELTSKLCTGNQYVKFDRDQLLAMDAKTAAEVLAQEISCGVSTINEARKRKNRATVKDGDTPLVNAANIPLATAIQARSAQLQQPNNAPAPQEKQ